MSQGHAEPLCARITGVNREVLEGKYLLTTFCFFPAGAGRERQMVKVPGEFLRDA